MRGLIVLLLLAGCRQVLGIEEATFDDSECIRDEFTSLDLRRWSVIDPASEFAIGVNDGRFVVTPTPSSAGENGIRGTPVDLSGGVAQIEVEPTSQTGGIETQFLFDIAPGTGFGFLVGLGTLTAQTFVNGMPDSTSIPFQFELRHWRVRHAPTAASELIVFEVSDDQIEWRVVKTAELPAAPSSVTPRLQATAFNGGNAEPGEAAFERFEVNCP